MSDGPFDRRRLLIPALAPLYRKLAPLSYAFMRFATGAVLVPHGVQKLLAGDPTRQAGNIGRHALPLPDLLSVLVVFTESVAALCLALGLFTRVAAAMIWVEMAVIITVFLCDNGYFWTQRGYEYALLWLLLCTAILFRGGGRYSLDRLIGKEL